MIGVDTQTVRSKGRDLSPPFRLMLRTAAKGHALTCTAILRHLPGKRLVCRGIWRQDQPVVAKIFLDASGAHRHYQRELQGIQALQNAHIPTPDLLFKGVLADGRAPVLLFREMEDYQNLTERLASVVRHDHRLETMHLVIAAIARLHAAGLKQRDMHPGNFLLAADKVLIIDGDDIETPTGRPLDRKRSWSNLGLFLAQFYPRFDAMVPDLAESYARARNWSIDPRTVAGLKARIQRWRRWRQRKYLQKTRRSCTAFIVMKKPHRFMACDRDWYSPTWQSLLDNPDALIEKGTILKAGNTATVAQVEVDSQPYVIKRYNIKNNRHALRRCLRPTRAMLSWENAHRLAFLGIDTPQPLAVIEERWWGLRRKAYFIMAHLQGATIDRVLPAVAQDQQTLNGHLDQLTRLLKQLVMAQLSHGDFKATNFILSSGRLYLVDLDGMRAHRSRSAFQQAFHRDLQRLHRNWRNFPEIYRPLADRTARLMAASARE